MSIVLAAKFSPPPWACFQCDAGTFCIGRFRVRGHRVDTSNAAKACKLSQKRPNRPNQKLRKLRTMCGDPWLPMHLTGALFFPLFFREFVHEHHSLSGCCRFAEYVRHTDTFYTHARKVKAHVCTHFCSIQTTLRLQCHACSRLYHLASKCLRTALLLSVLLPDHSTLESYACTSKG